MTLRSRPWLIAGATLVALLAGQGSSVAQPAERLILERRDGVVEQVTLQAIRSLTAADSELVVRTGDRELRIRLADIRVLRFEPTTTAVDPEGAAWVEAIRLLQNRPNPAVRSTTIGFDLARRGRVTLEIYSVAGRRIRTLVDRVVDSGRHEVAWDGVDDRGRRVEAGVYFYRMKGLGREHSRRAVMLP
jgi:hypothetical protein